MPSPSITITDALSFDIEDWFHLVGIASVADRDRWDGLPTLVERYTRQILETLAARDVRSTFFILGWIAEKYPALVREIASAGHELALHSHWHRPVNKLDPGTFRDDLRRNLDAIAACCDRPVLGFRAPSFSIRPGSEWAFDVLLDLGLRYDASLFPAPRGDGGYPCQPGPHTFTDIPSGRTMPELPMSVMRLGPARVPFSGGGYLRLLPPWLIRRGFDGLHRRGLPVVVYLHPRDFAPDAPDTDMPWHRRFRANVGQRTTQAKLDMLLDRYCFDTCAAVLGLDEA